jgi:signal transduction histidine kinase
MKSPIPQKISIKLALVIGTLVFVLLSVLGIALTQMTQDVLKENIQRSHEEITVRAAREVSLFVSRPAELLTTAGKLVGRTRADRWTQETILVEMSLEFPMFEEILSLDLQGQETASSNPGHPPQNKKEDPAFRAALQGKIYFSSIRIGSDYLPHVTLAVPFEHMGKVSGVLLAQVNLRGIWEIVDGIKLGRTGYAFVISEKGLLVAHPDKQLIFQNLNLSEKPFFSKMVSGKTGSVDGQGRSAWLLLSYTPLQSPLPLVVVLRMEAWEAYQLLSQMRTLVWFIISLSLLISMIVSVLLARWLVKPVRSLSQWSKKVALGDFDYHLPPTSSDELGRLFLRFKRMSKRLKAAQERERLAALGEAATTISHKLKNSIVSLKTFAQLLPLRKQDERFMRKFEDSFSSTVEHLERMFKNLSQVASFRKPNIVAIALDELLRNILDSYADTFERMGIECHYEGQSGLPPVEGDAEQIKDLFINLVQNAIHAMAKGGDLTVRAVFQADDRLLRISVIDNGCGIRSQDLNKIFKPFFTTKHGGMGLGLSISKKILEGHGGSIHVTSIEGKGSLFVVTLPVKAGVEIPVAVNREILA